MPSSTAIAIGYLIVKAVPRPVHFSAQLLPAKILSASHCICPSFPDSFALNWVNAGDEARAEEFRRLGLPEHLWGQAATWATAEFERSFGWPNCLFSAEAALAARQLFFVDEPDIHVLGLGLSESRLDEFIRAATPLPSPSGFAPTGKSGSLHIAERRQPLGPGFMPLGYELLNVGPAGLDHSWLCNGLETHFASTLGVSPTLNGLIASSEDADHCCDDLNSGKVGAEPGLWLPVWLVEYT